MGTFTAEQIEEVISIVKNEFKNSAPSETFQNISRGVTQYTGARYVPLFAEPLEWDNVRTYEPLTIVLHEGNSYTSRQYVPAGIDINNDAFWAITGNYNAQIEAYRAEVAAYNIRLENVEVKSAQAISDAKTANDAIAAEATRATSEEEKLSLAIADEKTERMEDTETVIEQLAGTTDSGLKDLIEVETTRAKNAERGLESKCAYSGDPIYLGNINLTGNDSEYSQPQGMCIIDNVAYAVATTGHAANDKCRVFKISLDNGDILGRYDVTWGHCNSISYCPEDGYMYVCPVTTHTSGSETRVNKFYKVNPTTMATVETVTMGVVPHSMYTDKITGEMYLVAETTDPTYKLDLYRFNRADNSIQLMGTIPTQLTGMLHMPIKNYYGTQTIKAWNGRLFFVLGGLGFNGFIELDSACNIVGAKNVGWGIDAFLNNELEDVDFDASGDMVFWSFSYPRCTSTIATGLLFGLNVFGNKIADVDNIVRENNCIYSIHVDPAANPDSIRELGTTAYPYKSFANAVSKAFITHSRVQVDGNCNTGAYIANIGTVTVMVASGKTLTMDSGYSYGNVQIETSSGSNATVAVSNTIFGSRTCFKNINVSGTASINGGILLLQGAKGGTFNGGGSAMLVKNSATTSTCSNFVVPTVS